MIIDRIIQTALRNRLLMVLLMAAVIGGGLWSWQRLTVDAVPDVSPTLVQVFTVTEGLAPQEVESFVSYPVERAMTGMPGVEEIRSTSNFGLSVVNVYFEDGTDIYRARQLVSEQLQQARDEIPEGFGNPQMGPIATGMGLILYYYLDDPGDRYSLTELRTFQDWLIKPRLETVRGVTEVLGIGGYEKQYQVDVDPAALQAHGLTLDQLRERIEAANNNVGAQFIERNGEQFVVRSEGLIQGVEDLEAVTIRAEGGTPVRLADVADVHIGGKIRRGLQTLNGDSEVVSAQVVQLKGADTSAVIERVERRLEEIQASLPEGVEIVPYYEQKSLIESSVGTVTTALLQGIGLVLLVLVAFMGSFRSSLVVALVIPFSILFAIIGMEQLGISANLMSLGGLAVAIGLLVDGTIVMVENIDRHLREADPERSRLHVVGRACREVARPMLFAGLIVIAVFLPLFTLTGVAGKTFGPLAYTVALAMGASLLYALLQAPVLGELVMRGGGGRKRGGAVSSRVFEALWRPYYAVLRTFVRFRWAAAVLVVVLIAAGAALVPRLGTEFTPRLNEGDIIANLTLAPSISLPEAKRMTHLAERRMLQVPAVEEVVSRVGRGEVGAHADPINAVHSSVILAPRSEWAELGYEDQAAIEAAIRERLSGMPGVAVNLTQPIQLAVDELVSGVNADLAIKLFGEDLQTLADKADAIADVVRGVPGAADVQAEQVTGAPQLRIQPDREALSRYGIDVATAQRTLRQAVGGAVAGEVLDGVRRSEIYVRLEPSARDDVQAIEDVLVPAPDGERVPLGQVADVEEIVGPRQITREDAQRFITIQANVVDRDIGSFVTAAQAAIDREVELPAGYLLDWGGQYELQQATNARLAVVVPITLALISLLLYSNFGSVRNTALILLNIPLALVGGVAALWLSGQYLSVPASVGFIALFGIALGNGMVLVSYLNELRRQGTPMDEAAITAARLRLRPVLMTTLTTGLGLAPLLFASGTGSEVQRPLATVVVGGLVTSTLITLLVLPALYKWLAPPRPGRPPEEEPEAEA